MPGGAGPDGAGPDGADPERDRGELAERLGRAGLRPLVDQLAHRFSESEAPKSIGLTGLTTDQQEAVADLLGEARLRGSATRLPMARIVTALAADVAGLRAAVEELRGPLPDRSAERAARAAERVGVWRWLEEQSAGIAIIADRERWLAGVRARGVRGGPERHRRRLLQAFAVLRALPADAVTLAELASDVLGDPHGLDAGRSVAALVLDAVDPDPVARPRDAESTRQLWESVGVAPDALSSTVLVLGLSGGPEHPLAGLLEPGRTGSEPCVLTLAQLRRWPLPALAAEERIFVVENPSLVAAGARSGWSGPVLVCSSGRPTVAVVTLIRQLTAAGAVAYQHADFDPAGVAITDWLSARADTVPWRMGVEDYRAALAVRAEPTTQLPPLSLAATPWSPALADALAEHRRPVYEEQLRDQLLARMQVGIPPLGD